MRFSWRNEEQVCSDAELLCVRDVRSAPVGTIIRTEFSSPKVKYSRDGKPADFWALNGSASLKDKTLTLTVVNADVSSPRDTEIVLRGATVTEAKSKSLFNKDMHAHNSFEHSDDHRPEEAVVEHAGSVLHFKFPAASVTAITIKLG